MAARASFKFKSANHNGYQGYKAIYSKTIIYFVYYYGHFYNKKTIESFGALID